MYYQLTFFYDDEKNVSQIRGVELSQRNEHDGEFSVISTAGSNKSEWTKSMQFSPSESSLAVEILRFIAKHLDDKPV